MVVKDILLFQNLIIIAKSLLTFCQHYGIRKRFHSDQGGEFVYNILKQLMKLLGSKHTFSTAYHPQTNSALERFHSVLRDYICMYSTKRSHNWDQIVPLAIMCHQVIKLCSVSQILLISIANGKDNTYPTKQQEKDSTRIIL